MRVISRALLIDKATAATISSVFVNSACDVLGIQVEGTFTSATVKVQGVVDENSTDWQDIAAIDLTDLSTKTSGITETGVYQAPIDSFNKVRVNVTAVSGGNISVYGQFADSSNN